MSKLEVIPLYCGSRTAAKADGTEVEGVCLRCRSWLCDYCFPSRKSQLVAQASAHKAFSLITITSQLDSEPRAEYAAVKIVRAFRACLAKHKRKHPQRVEYLAWMEETPTNKWPHLHVLWDGGIIDPKDWSDLCAKICAGPIFKVKKIKDETHARKYCAKYTEKGPKKYPGCKRYWTSKGWSPGFAKKFLTKSAEGEWKIKQQNFGEWLKESFAFGLVVVRQTRWWVRLAHGGDEAAQVYAKNAALLFFQKGRRNAA